MKKFKTVICNIYTPMYTVYLLIMDDTYILTSGEFDDDIEAMTFTKGKVEGLIAHEQYEIETRGGMCSLA